MAALPALATNDSERFFLGVEKSATGRSWRDRLDERGQARALTIAQRSGVPELLARLLAGRGVEVSDVQDFPWGRFVYFSDPDGNAWSVQQLPAR